MLTDTDPRALLGSGLQIPRAGTSAPRLRIAKRLRRWLPWAALAAAFAMLGLVPLRAPLEQFLIARAWQYSVADHVSAKPWPWAHAWPIARLSIPGDDLVRYVLAGADGAIGGSDIRHLPGTALPGQPGNSVIEGQSRSDLAFLRDLPIGTELTVEGPDGVAHRYRVRYILLIDQRDMWITKQEGPSRLTLLLRAPDEKLPGHASMRYVISAYEN